MAHATLSVGASVLDDDKPHGLVLEFATTPPAGLAREGPGFLHVFEDGSAFVDWALRDAEGGAGPRWNLVGATTAADDADFVDAVVLVDGSSARLERVGHVVSRLHGHSLLGLPAGVASSPSSALSSPSSASASASASTSSSAPAASAPLTHHEREIDRMVRWRTDAVEAQAREPDALDGLFISKRRAKGRP